jgi:predicted porin
MKKSLIALAALSAFATAAQAQSSVTVYGVLDIGYSDTNNKLTNADGTSAKHAITSTGNGDGGLATSRLGFRGVEDLGGGLKANFVLEYDLVDSGSQNTADLTPSTTASALGARYSWVGLEDAKLGQLRLGRQESSIHSVVTAGSAGGANNVAGTIYSAGGVDTSFKSATLGADFNTSVRPHQVFVNKAVTYISPVMSGVRFELQYAKLNNEVSGSTTSFADDPEAIEASKTDRTVLGASLKYSAGKLALAYGHQELKLKTLAAADNDKTKADVFSGSYDLGAAKVFALHSTQKKTEFDYTNKITNTELGVQVPMGKTVLFASMFDGNVKENDDGTNTKLNTQGYQAGALYNLSKRTALYGIYGKQEVKGTGDASGFKLSTDQLSAGVRHTF